MRTQVVLDHDEWESIDKVLQCARQVNLQVARNHAKSPAANTALLELDLTLLLEAVCQMDGLCTQQRCKWRARHPASEHIDATEDE